MGYSTLAMFRTEMQSALGNLSYDEPRLDNWINYGYHDVAGAVDFEALDVDETIQTVSGTPTILAPENTNIIKVVRDETNDRLVTWAPKPEFFRRLTAASGAPEYWTRNGLNIVLHPTPDAVIDIRVIAKKPPDRLAEDTSQTVLSDTWDPAIFLFGMHHALLALGQEQRSSSWLARAVTYVQSRITEADFHTDADGLGASLPIGMGRLLNRIGGGAS